MKYALVIGASSDIGSSIVEELASSGWSLYLHYHTNEKRVVAEAKALQESYPEQDFFVLQADLTEAKAAAKISEQVFGVDAIVFASGKTYYGLLKETPDEIIQQMWHIHLATPIRLIQQLEDKLARSGEGRIVFISSVYGEAGSAMEVAYSTTKGAQVAFIKSYSKEVASLGITVNALSPGAIETEMLDRFSEEDLKTLAMEIPMGRLGNISEVGIWVRHLLEPSASYLTGQSIIMSGGWLR